MLSRCRSPRARLAINVVTAAAGLGVTVLAGRHFAAQGWPLAHADVWLVTASAVLFLAGYAFKAYGWSRLFVPSERPGTASLAAAGGAASVTGIALPGRFDDVVRIAVVRRHRGCPAGIKALMLSLFTLGLIDAVALTPLASSAAAVADIPVTIRVGLAVVAGAGIAAALVVVLLPRIDKRLLRFRIARWLSEHSPRTREASKAFVFVLASWLTRGVALCLLLGALGLGLSIPLAMVFLCAGAASAALPIAPAGAATQAGAGAGALVASGVSVSQAVSFAVGAQMLVIFAGVAAILAASAWNAGQRLNARRVSPV